MTNRRLFISLCLLLLVSLLLATSIGSTSISLTKQLCIVSNTLHITNFDIDHRDVSIIVYFRLPRAILAALIGFSLALCGTVMQGIFRNPLADPYLLGIASGATMGATAIIVLGFSLSVLIPIGAFFGGAISVAITYFIARSKLGSLSNVTLILAGVAMGAFFSAITTFFIFSSEDEQLRHIIFWIMGSLEKNRWEYLLYLSVLIIATTMCICRFSRELNALSLGDDMAFHLGVDPLRIKKWLLFLITLLTAAAVSIAGTIGFVGIVIPHTMRLLCGANHQRLLLASGLAGAIFLILCDILSRTMISSMQVPIGVITAMIGAPFFLYLLLQHKKTTKKHYGY